MHKIDIIPLSSFCPGRNATEYMPAFPLHRASTSIFFNDIYASCMMHCIVVELNSLNDYIKWHNATSPIIPLYRLPGYQNEGGGGVGPFDKVIEGVKLYNYAVH